MDWMDPFWPDDLSQVQWGTMSQWASALLSGVSIILAFYIIIRDRRKAEEEQARQLVVREQGRSRRNHGYSNLVTITNTSKYPFYDVHLTIFFDKADKRRSLRFNYVTSRRRRREIERLKWAIRKGGRDDWPLLSSAGDERTNIDDPDRDTLNPDQSFIAKVSTFKHKNHAYIVVHARDAQGRYWAYEPITRAMFRYDKLRDY